MLYIKHYVEIIYNTIIYRYIYNMDHMDAKLNITSVNNSLLVGQTVNDFLTVSLVSWWPVSVQLKQISTTIIGNVWYIEPEPVQA